MPTLKCPKCQDPVQPYSREVVQRAVTGFLTITQFAELQNYVTEHSAQITATPRDLCARCLTQLMAELV